MLKVVRLAYDATMVSVFFAAVKQSHGIEIRTDGIENDSAKQVLKSYLGMGDTVVDFAASQAKGYKQFFTETSSPSSSKSTSTERTSKK